MECWDYRGTEKGLASCCKNCAFYAKRQAHRIPDSIRCWEYLDCKEDCSVRNALSLEHGADDDETALLGRGRKIVVLDDSKTLRNLVKLILEEYEYEVDVASNGREAIEKFNRWHPHLLVCDINLTGSTMTGMDVLVYAKTYKKDLRVIMLSSRADKETVDFCIQNGADAFVQKPFKNEDLVRKIYHVLRSEPNVKKV